MRSDCYFCYFFGEEVSGVEVVNGDCSSTNSFNKTKKKMINKVFSITGTVGETKISAFIADEDALKFASSNYDTVDEFREAFAKKLSLTINAEIKYNSIKSIKKEDNNNIVLIAHKAFLGSAECAFSFTDSEDYNTFFTFLEKEKYFTKHRETLTPFGAIKNQLIVLLIVICFTILCYYVAVGLANGTVKESYDTIFFDVIIGFIGNKGVLAVGILISAYLVYKIWQRFSNPPNQIIFLPPKYVL